MSIPPDQICPRGQNVSILVSSKIPQGEKYVNTPNLSTTSIICRSNTNWIGICENIDFYKTLWRVKTIYILYVLVFQRKPCLRLMNRLTL